MQYKAIGFDYGGVIHGMPGPLFNQKVADLLELPVNVVMKEYFARNHQANVGKVTYNEVWKEVFSVLKRPEAFGAFFKFQTDWEAKKVLNTEFLDLSDQLRKAGYKTGILSNASAEMAEYVRKEKIDTHFDVYLPSCEIGCMKPDRRAYTALVEALQIEMSSLIFIDDTPRSLESADELGYTPVLFENYPNLILKLRELNLSF